QKLQIVVEVVLISGGFIHLHGVLAIAEADAGAILRGGRFEAEAFLRFARIEGRVDVDEAERAAGQQGQVVHVIAV
ncbi:MAG: hypothetical protein D6687_11475, partial [Acidobacteria bacterium]